MRLQRPAAGGGARVLLGAAGAGGAGVGGHRGVQRGVLPPGGPGAGGEVEQRHRHRSFDATSANVGGIRNRSARVRFRALTRNQALCVLERLQRSRSLESITESCPCMDPSSVVYVLNHSMVHDTHRHRC